MVLFSFVTIFFKLVCLKVLELNFALDEFVFDDCFSILAEFLSFTNDVWFYSSLISPKSCKSSALHPFLRQFFLLHFTFSSFWWPYCSQYSNSNWSWIVLVVTVLNSKYSRSRFLRQIDVAFLLGADAKTAMKLSWSKYIL